MFFRHDVGQTLQNVCCCDTTFLVMWYILTFSWINWFDFTRITRQIFTTELHTVGLRRVVSQHRDRVVTTDCCEIHKMKWAAHFHLICTKIYGIWILMWVTKDWYNVSFLLVELNYRCVLSYTTELASERYSARPNANCTNIWRRASVVYDTPIKATRWHHTTVGDEFHMVLS